MRPGGAEPADRSTRPAGRTGRTGLSLRAAAAALVLYLGVGLAVAAPLGGGWWILVVAGGAFLVLVLRTGRTVLLAVALTLATLAWAAPAVRRGNGSGGAALALGVVLALVAVLARVALDAAPRRGPVRIDPVVRRRLWRETAAAVVLGLAGGFLVLAATASARPPPPSVLLPVGLLVLPALVTGVAVAIRGFQGRGAPGAGRWWTVGVILAVMGLPLLAGLAARAPLPARSSTSSGVDRTVLPVSDSLPEDAPPENPPLPARRPNMGLALGLVGVGTVLSLLLARGKRMESADDRRPDRPPPEEVPHGAPQAPTIEALAPEAVAQMIDDALLQLRDELDPRLAVRCAYASVAAGLGNHERARKPSETELEFVERHLRSLGAGGPALERLTDIFELARFSEHPVDDAMRQEAVVALGDLRQVLGEVPSSSPSVSGTSGLKSGEG